MRDPTLLTMIIESSGERSDGVSNIFLRLTGVLGFCADAGKVERGILADCEAPVCCILGERERFNDTFEGAATEERVALREGDMISAATIAVRGRLGAGGDDISMTESSILLLNVLYGLVSGSVRGLDPM